MGVCLSCRRTKADKLRGKARGRVDGALLTRASPTDKNNVVGEHPLQLRARPDDTALRQLNGAPSKVCRSCPSPRSSLMDTISNMKMTNPIKGLVSKRRKRYTEDGYNLDLTCILFVVRTRLFTNLYVCLARAQLQSNPVRLCSLNHFTTL